VHLEHRGGTLRGRGRRLRAVVGFHRCAWVYWRKHARKPSWHPATLAVAAGLGLRLSGAVLLQAAREITGADRRYDG
jgi:hypothetical protein